MESTVGRYLTNPAAKNGPIAGIIAGPTASGKTSLAVKVAKRHGFAIISGDSMQVYRGMTIGTGAATEEERDGVPHHLIAIANPDEEFHARRFVEEATSVAQQQIESTGRRSLIAGGTGMWLQALREGLIDGPGRDEAIRSELREQLDQEGPEALHGYLAQVDPTMAKQLTPRDHVRIIRAIEIYRLSGRPQSDWLREDRQRRAALGSLLPLYVLNPDRELLYRRINERVEAMIAAGWLEEARGLKEWNLPEHSPARKALGYRELFRVLDGEWTLEEAIPQIKKLTRNYAKRQLTWFRAQRDAMLDETPSVERCEEFLGI